MAERRYNPKGFRWAKSAVDLKKASELIIRISGSEEEAQAYMKLLKVQTGHRVASPMIWAQIEALGEKLVDQGILTGKEARETMRSGVRGHGGY